MTDASYVPGDRTVIAGDRCWVLIDAVPDSAVVAEIWPRMQREPELDALVASLLRLGFDHVPDFVLLVAAGSRHRLICRGRASATLAGGGPPERVDGAGLATWLERQVAGDVRQVVLGEPPAGPELRLPVSAGVFLARCVVVDLATGTRDRGAASAPAVMPSAVVAQAPPGVARAVTAGEDLTDLDGGSGGTRYDYLFGATEARTVEDAAVRLADESDADVPSARPAAAGRAPAPRHARPSGPPGAPWPPGPPGPLRVPAPPEPPEPPGPATGGLIDAVPWGPGADDMPSGPTRVARVPGRPVGFVPEAIGRSPAPADPDDDVDGSTVVRGEPLRLAPGPAAPDRIGPTVHALLCPDSHVNPPTSSACRQCGVPLPPQDPVTILRPVLGVLRLSTGDVITLDRGVVMGRSPRTEFRGAERPHVVKLPSGDGEVSRTHLEVSLDGWHVLVTDLHSTNGTIVVLPGRDPARLRPGEPMPIQPGTLVIVAVDIDFRYEAAE